MTVSAETKRTIELWHDEDGEDPLTWDDWEMWSFSRRHASFKHPDEFDLSDPENFGLRSKLRAGTAFWLRYYEHGRCEWALAGEGSPGSGCPWDSVSRAGILIWNGRPGDLGPSPEARRERARNLLEVYTAWANGDVYGYSVMESCGECGRSADVEDSCGGFYGTDASTEYMIDQALKSAGVPFEQVRWEGDAAFLADCWTPPERRKGRAA